MPAPLGVPAPLTGERGRGEAWRRHTAPVNRAARRPYIIHCQMGRWATVRWGPLCAWRVADSSHAASLHLRRFAGCEPSPASPFSPGGRQVLRMGPPCKSHSFSVAKQCLQSLPLWRKETALGTEWRQRPTPDRAAEDRLGHSRAEEGAGDPQPTSLSSPGGRVPCCGHQECWLWSFKGSLYSVGRGTEPTPWGSAILPTGCWPQKWHLPRGKTNPKRLHTLLFPLHNIFGITKC